MDALELLFRLLEIGFKAAVKMCIRDRALDVTRRTAGVPTPDFGGHLARCDYYTVDLLAAPQATTCGAESFLSLLILDGEGEVRCGGETVRAKKGDSLFLPAGSGEVRLTGTLRALATRI